MDTIETVDPLHRARQRAVRQVSLTSEPIAMPRRNPSNAIMREEDPLAPPPTVSLSAETPHALKVFR